MSYNNYPKANFELNTSKPNSSDCKNGEIVVTDKTKSTSKHSQFISFYIPASTEIFTDNKPRFSRGKGFVTFELVNDTNIVSSYICPYKNVPLPYTFEQLPPYFQKAEDVKNPELLSTWENDENYKNIINVINRYNQLSSLGASSNSLKRGQGDYAKQLRIDLTGAKYGFKPNNAGAAGIVVMVIQIVTHYKKTNLIEEWKVYYNRLKLKYNDLLKKYLNYQVSMITSQYVFNVIELFSGLIEKETNIKLNSYIIADMTNVILSKIGANYESSQFNFFNNQWHNSTIEFPYGSQLNYPKFSALSYKKIEEIIYKSLKLIEDE